VTGYIPLLLADPSPTLRLLVLRHLLKRSAEDAEVRELMPQRQEDPLISRLLERQTTDGYWPIGDTHGRKGALQGTTQALIRLGTLGFGPEIPAVRAGAEFLFAQQKYDGSWPLAGDLEQKERYSNYDMIPLQTAMPLRALAVTGFATDPQTERAYEWLLAQRLEDGAWPTGKTSGTFGRVAGYRRLPHSRWGCRSNTTGVLLCLAHHPQRRTSPEAQRALDHLLARETHDRQAFGFEIARIIGAEQARGLFTYFAHFDLALILDLCWRTGASLSDSRVASLVRFINSLRGPYGLWVYQNQPHVDRWLTYYLLRALSVLEENKEWISLEPSTPFQPYPRREARY
jgi:hypothetical protein